MTTTSSWLHKNEAAPEPRRGRPGLAKLGQRLRSIIYMAGSVRPGRLATATQRSLLDLPLERDWTLLDCWHGHAGQLAEAIDSAELQVRILINQQGVAPTTVAGNGRVRMQVERDPQEYRGTAGLLRDATVDYASDDWVLVVGGVQWPVRPLVDMAEQLAEAGSDVALLAQRDGTPCHLMLVRCGLLRQIKARGFLDVKEQWLSEVAEQRRVVALEQTAPALVPVRTRADYLRAVRTHHFQQRGVADGNPFAEYWQPTFSLIERGGSVAATARIHDSVVLAGGVVGEGATLVHSVIGSGGSAGAHAMLVDQVVGRQKPTRTGASG